jgi:predicted MFS family arabinose efflux permease
VTTDDGPTAQESRIVWTVAMIQLINVLDFMMVMPLGEDFAQSLAIDPSKMGYVSGAYTAAAFTGGVIGAKFLDRFDRKPPLVLAMIGLALGTALGGIAQGLGTMILARVVAGLFGGPATSLSLAIVADTVPVHRRGRAMAKVMAGFSVASVLGIPAGLALARAGSWRMPFFIIAGFALVGAIVAARVLPPVRGHLDGPPRRRTPALELIRRPEIATGLATGALVLFSVFIIVPNIPSYLMRNLGFPREHYELLYLAGGAASFITLQISGRWVDKATPLRVMLTGTAMSIAAIALGFSGEAWIPIPLVFVLFMSSGSFRGLAHQTLATRLPAPAERAQYMSLQSAIQHAAMTAGAFTAAMILTEDPKTKTISPVWVVGAIAILLAALAPVLLAATVRALERRDRSA